MDPWPKLGHISVHRPALWQYSLLHPDRYPVVLGPKIADCLSLDLTLLVLPHDLGFACVYHRGMPLDPGSPYLRSSCDRLNRACTVISKCPPQVCNIGLGYMLTSPAFQVFASLRAWAISEVGTASCGASPECLFSFSF